MEQLEADIARLNEEKAQLEAIFSSGASAEEIDKSSKRYNELKDELDEKELQWLELSEIPN
jgi:ATP-binding cassette subfamily F protein uup